MAGERIPTLEEILEFSKKNDVAFDLELKPEAARGAEHVLIGALRESGEVARVVVISFDPGILAGLRKIEPTLMTRRLARRAASRSLTIRGGCRCPGKWSFAAIW